MTEHPTTDRVDSLLTRAREGDRVAWEALVEDHTPMLRAIARRHRLGDAEVADAVQTTWLRLVEHLDDVRDADRLAGWLATTVRRQCLAARAHAPRWEPEVDGTDEESPERWALRSEHAALVRQVLRGLPERHRTLVVLLSASPAPSYHDVAARLGIPVGSIGPTRGRILARMRAELVALGLHDAVPA